MTFPISRQGMEQIAIALLVGAAVFGLLTLYQWRRGGEWRRFAQSTGVLGTLVVATLGIAYTIAPNIPTPPVPFTARFAQNPTPDDPATVAYGRALYQANCSICHGPRGLGDGPAAFTLNPRPFNLQVHVPQHAPGELFYWISEGVASAAMPAWKDKLNETERWEIVRYLQALAAGQDPSATAAPSGRPRVTSVVAVGDTITVTFDRPMLQIGEGSGVEMSGNYQLDSRTLPQAAKIACHTRDCFEVGIALPAGTLAPGTAHTLRIANVVAKNGPAIGPDPTTLPFTVR